MGSELVLKLDTPDGLAASAIATRVASLHHEAFDDTMEDDAVVVAGLRERSKILHRFGCMLRKQSKWDVTKRGMNDRGGG